MFISNLTPSMTQYSKPMCHTHANSNSSIEQHVHAPIAGAKRHTNIVFGKERVSCLLRCPNLRVVLIDWLHYIHARVQRYIIHR